jgi:hypothetical protein
MCAFAVSDLQRRTFELRGQEVKAVAPLAERTVALERLESRRTLLNGWFAKNGGLDSYFDAFAQHLRALPGRHLSIELEEIEALHAQFDMPDILTQALARLDAGEETCLDLLIPLSTVLEDRKFLPLDRVAASDAREDRWNVYRLIGGGWLLPTPWDSLDEQLELTRKLNAARQRGAFELRIRK